MPGGHLEKVDVQVPLAAPTPHVGRVAEDAVHEPDSLPAKEVPTHDGGLGKLATRCRHRFGIRVHSNELTLTEPPGLLGRQQEAA